MEAALSSGVALDNDIGIFFRSFADEGWYEFETPPKVIAVTGSNGKSTTSALIHHILTEAGRPTQLAGNIGRGVMDIDPPHDGEVIVLELSSYQTELARALTPDIAVFTNLSPDHLDRHGGYGGYFAAKRRLFIEGAQIAPSSAWMRERGNFWPINSPKEGMTVLFEFLLVKSKSRLERCRAKLAETRKGRQQPHLICAK